MTYEELVKNHSADMISKLVAWVLSQDKAEIRFDFADDDQWAIISMHIYEEDKEISLRLHFNDRYDLYFGYYDDEDEFFEIIQPLTEEEKKILPEALRKMMKHVLDKEEGVQLPADFLKN